MKRTTLTFALASVCITALAQNVETTAFPNETYVAASLAGVNQNCEQAPTNLTVASQGKYGTAVAGTVTAPYDSQPQCPPIPWNVIKYTWTSTDSAANIDSVSIIGTIDGASAPSTLKIKKAYGKVTGVDMAAGFVYLDFGASTQDTQAIIDLEFIRSDGTVSKQTGTTYLSPAAGLSIFIDRPRIPKGVYNKLRVTLRAMTLRALNGSPVPHTITTEYTPPKAWNVLGVIQYTKYNVPAESSCAGANAEVYVVDAIPACNFTKTTLKTDFVSQTHVNGTGKSASYGLIQSGAAVNLISRCAGKVPGGATSTNSFLKVTAVVGACRVPLVADLSIATYESMSTANCGMTVALVDRTTKATFQSNRRRDDHCPACSSFPNGTDGHIDSFSSAESCSTNVGNLGNYWTARTN